MLPLALTCGGDPVVAACVPGRTVACDCEAGAARGLQTCRPDGAGFGACAACVETPIVFDAHFVEVSSEAKVGYHEGEPIDGQSNCVIESFCEFNLFTGAVAVGDYDSDGWPDLWVSRRSNTPVLFRNQGDGTFVDVTANAGLAISGNWNGAAWLDVDNDGDLDLAALTFGDDRYFLFINDGNGHFADEAEARGTAFDDGALKLSMSVAVGDYDRDGWLDLHVTEWSAKGVLPQAQGHQFLDPKRPGHTRLLHNRGAAAPGHFEDVTEPAGALTDPPAADGTYANVFAHGTAFADFDGDDWPELAVSGDFGTSRFFWNNSGKFEESSVASGVAKDRFGMGSSIADIDGDGRLDWLVTSISGAPSCVQGVCLIGESGNHLYRARDDRMFEDVGEAWLLHDGFWAWGAAMFDQDNDGDLDVVQTNGADYPMIQANSYFATDPNRFWKNEAGTFVERSDALGISDTRRGKGLVTLDFDRDGDLDVFVVNNSDTPSLFRNDGAHGDWLRVRVLGPGGRDATGARVTIRKAATLPPRVAFVGVGTHFLGQSESIVHFGLGAQTGPVAEVEVHWADSGKTKVLTDVEKNQVLVVEP